MVDTMSGTPRYMLVEYAAAPAVFRKVIEVKNLLATGAARSVNEAVKKAGLSRSAYYKYKQSVHRFDDAASGRLITISALLCDRPGVLSAMTGKFHQYGANIITINQSIPVGGIAPVSVTARIDGMNISLAALLDRLRATDGIKNIEVISGLGPE